MDAQRVMSALLFSGSARCSSRQSSPTGTRRTPPAFGEEEIFEKLRAWMLDRGFSEAEVNSQVDRLASSKHEAAPSPTEAAEESSDADTNKPGIWLAVAQPLADSRMSGSSALTSQGQRWLVIWWLPVGWP